MIAGGFQDGGAGAKVGVGVTVLEEIVADGVGVFRDGDGAGARGCEGDQRVRVRNNDAVLIDDGGGDEGGIIPIVGKGITHAGELNLRGFAGSV